MTSKFHKKLKYPFNNLTFKPLRIWYMRNCTWSSVSFWHFTMLLRSAPIKWVTRYLPITGESRFKRAQVSAGVATFSHFAKSQMDTNEYICTSTHIFQSCLQSATNFPYGSESLNRFSCCFFFHSHFSPEGLKGQALHKWNVIWQQHQSDKWA